MTGRSESMSHEQKRSELPELAADVLDGRARAELLDHVDSCVSCTVELEELTLAVDSLVHLGIEADPPLGFETRVFDQMSRRPSPPPMPRHHRWRHRSLLAVGAAAAAAVLAFGLGWAVHSGDGPVHHAVATPSPADRSVEAPLVSAGRTVGVVSVYPNGRASAGDPAWLSMSVDASPSTGPWAGTVWCKVTTTDGSSRTVGSFSLTSGYGTWMVPLPMPAGAVRSATLVDSGGQVLAAARFGRPPTGA
ncbi:MAG: hypothetical protein ACRDYE_09795 [Acidimicrobiales bacterium]